MAVWVFQEGDSEIDFSVQNSYLVALSGSVSEKGWRKKEDWAEKEVDSRCRLIASAYPSESSRVEMDHPRCLLRRAETARPLYPCFDQSLDLGDLVKGHLIGQGGPLQIRQTMKETTADSHVLTTVPTAG